MNPVLANEIKKLRKKGLKRAKGLKKPVKWKEKDFLMGGEVEAGVIILPTRGCSWGLVTGCSMCGYVYDAGGGLTQGELATEFVKALEKLEGISYLKIFNSGSFFDRGELKKNTVKRIVDEVNNRHEINVLQVESRPEYITDKNISFVTEKLNPQLEIGIGLETSSDYIRENSINKGFSLEDFKRAVKLAKKYDVKVKTYLLLKPPFLPEKEAIEDAVKSGVEAAKLGARRISYNPMNIQKDTLVEYLFERGDYRAPWLWSLVEVLKRVKTSVDVPVLSHPSAAGKVRGPHNCGKCDKEIAGAIRSFSVSQDLRYLEGLDCECKREWEDSLAMELLG